MDKWRYYVVPKKVFRQVQENVRCCQGFIMVCRLFCFAEVYQFYYYADFRAYNDC